MKKYIKTKNEKGITLIALVVTIIIMFIIAGVSINIGTNSLKNTRLQGFYTQLEIIQNKVDYIATTNENYSTLGSALTTTQNTNLQNILSNEGAGLGLTASTFRYFTIAQLESILGLSDMEYNVFVDFDSRTVIAEEGITIDGTTYHLLYSKTYYVEVDTSKTDELAISSLEFSITNYGTTYHPTGTSISGNNNTVNTVTNTIIYNGTANYKITVTPFNKAGEKMSGGTLKYKKSANKYWETANGLEFIISLSNGAGQIYDIIYEDNNQNKVETTVHIWMKEGYPQIFGRLLENRKERK